VLPSLSIVTMEAMLGAPTHWPSLADQWSRPTQLSSRLVGVHGRSGIRLRGAAAGTKSAPQHEEADGDQHRLERKGNSQPVLVRQAAEQVGGSGGDQAEDQLRAGVGPVLTSASGVEGEREGERIEVRDAHPAHEQPQDGEGRLVGQPEQDEARAGDGQ
jgi:hypothetical protein